MKIKMNSKNTIMRLTGKIHKLLPQEEISLKDGSKRIKNGFVVMCGEEFPKTVAFEMWGEGKASMLTMLSVGDEVDVSFYITSSETQNGGYRTSLRCMAVEPKKKNGDQYMPPSEAPSSNTTPWTLPTYTSADDGLPFGDDEPPL